MSPAPIRTRNKPRQYIPACCVRAGCVERAGADNLRQAGVQPGICLCRTCLRLALGLALAGGAGTSWAQGAEEDEAGSPLPSLELAYLVAAGVSDVNDEELADLQIGSHEANRNRRPIHLLAAAVDLPLAQAAKLHLGVMGRHPPGEAASWEVEEGYLTLGKAEGVQLKAGLFFTEFGRINPQHFEDGPFTDKPVIHNRLFGDDQLGNPGARVALPLPWAGSRMLVGAQQASGESASSFLSSGGEEVAGHPILYDHRSRAPLFSARLERNSDSDRGEPGWGVSLAYGPNGTGRDTHTAILGSDFGREEPEPARLPALAAWRTEILYRRYEAGDTADSGREILRDWGLVGYGLWQLTPRCVGGLRAEHARGLDAANDDPQRDRRTRLAGNATWQVGEFLQLRVQYNRDWATHLPSGHADSLWLQLKVSMEQEGAAAH